MRKMKRGRISFSLEDQASENWRCRAEMAVTLMENAEIEAHRIADWGCGDKKILDILRGRLPYDFVYQGYDLLPQREDVLEIDLNETVPQEGADLVFCLGLLEYIDNLNQFFCSLREVTRYAVVSYVASDSGVYPEEVRQVKDWKHNYGSNEIADCLRESGFRVVDRKVIHEGRTFLFLAEVVKK